MTIHHDVQQGSPEWHNLKKGMPTASNFHRIVTPAKWQLSGQARRYAFRLAAEILLDAVFPESLDGIEAVKRGRDLEPEAVIKYEQESKSETTLVGLLTTDDGRIGASPDRLIVGLCPAGLEVKCPLPPTHLEYLIDGFGSDYLIQAQGQIFVGEFDFVDRYSYHPQAPSVLARTWRDDKQQKILQETLSHFLDIRDEIIEHAKRRGAFTPEMYGGRNDE